MLPVCGAAARCNIRSETTSVMFNPRIIRERLIAKKHVSLLERFNISAIYIIYIVKYTLYLNMLYKLFIYVLKAIFVIMNEYICQL